MADISSDIFHTLNVGFQPDKYAKDVLFWIALFFAVCAALIVIEQWLSNRNDENALATNKKMKEKS